MRRDVFITNDSGGLSVIAADAVDAIIQDARTDDLRFVTEHKALLLELDGDDSMPVRIVVNEPLRDDEEAQWLARATWRIDTSDGRLLVMGGFDPVVLGWWRDESGSSANGRGVALFESAPGSWRVDVYAHAGSMNGRQILSGADVKPGTAFAAATPAIHFPCGSQRCWSSRAKTILDTRRRGRTSRPASSPAASPSIQTMRARLDLWCM